MKRAHARNRGWGGNRKRSRGKPPPLPRPFELHAREGSPQNAHGVARVQEDVARLGYMGIAHHEPARRETTDRLVQVFQVVRERPVVEVHRVLGGCDDADAEGARLLHQRDDGPLGGRIRWVGKRMRRDGKQLAGSGCGERVLGSSWLLQNAEGARSGPAGWLEKRSIEFLKAASWLGIGAMGFSKPAGWLVMRSPCTLSQRAGSRCG